MVAMHARFFVKDIDSAEAMIACMLGTCAGSPYS